jgi:hypothetical protein
MPRTFRYEGKTYRLPDGTSDQDALDFISGQHTEAAAPPPVDPDAGFWAHATKTLRGLPDAVLSGRIITDPIDAVGQSMKDYMVNPTFHNSIRAIPGVGMVEDMLTAPYKTGASGDLKGGWGDAVDLAAQALFAHKMGARVPEPLQEFGTPAPKPVKTPGPVVVPDVVMHASHLAPGPLGAVFRAGSKAINAASKHYGGSIEPVAPNPFPPEGVRIYDTRYPPERPNTDRWTGIPPDPTSGPTPGQYEKGAHPVPPPVEVGGAHIPTDMLPPPGMSPDEFAAKLQADRYPKLASDHSGYRPSTSATKDWGLVPDRRPPVEVGGAHIPPGAPTPFGLPPDEMAQALQAQQYPPTAGPTAPSARPDARFKPGQYDAPRPRPQDYRNPPSKGPTSLGPPIQQIPPEEMAKRISLGNVQQFLDKEPPPPPAQPAATPASNPVNGHKVIQLPTAGPFPAPSQTDLFTPPPVKGPVILGKGKTAAADLAPLPPPPGTAPAAAGDNYAFTHPKDAERHMRTTLYAQGHSMFKDGILGPDYREQFKQASQAAFGRSISSLNFEEMGRLYDFLSTHQRLPVAGELK